MLNNQPMGFYQPATLVKDAQRHGLHFLPVDVTLSAWECTLEHSKGEWAVRLGFNYVRGMRKQTAEAIALARPFCSLDDLAARVPGIRKEELRILAEIGALNPLRQEHRRAALWEAERALRVAGPLFENLDSCNEAAPLTKMNAFERTRADYSGTGLTIGTHPISLYRPTFAKRGVVRAADLMKVPDGRWVRVAGCVICRQRPGTAKGFVFLSLEDETGIANAIVTPDLFEAYRLPLVQEPYLLVEGVLQNLQGTVPVKVQRVEAVRLSADTATRSHDFH